MIELFRNLKFNCIDFMNLDSKYHKCSFKIEQRTYNKTGFKNACF